MPKLSGGKSENILAQNGTEMRVRSLVREGGKGVLPIWKRIEVLNDDK